jgi:hypothetical protein
MSLSLPKKVLAKYLNPVFIETGTHMGDGVQLALNLGFEAIYSIEKNKEYFAQASRRFDSNERPYYEKVHLYLGNSVEVLQKILPIVIWEPINITFWLDAHLDPSEEDDTKQTPIMQELEIIKKYCQTDDPNLTPDILIDDLNQFGGKCHSRTYLRDIWSQVNEDEVISKIMEISPNYKLYIKDNKFNPNGILIASVKQNKESWIRKILR